MPVAILLTDARGAVIRDVNRTAGDILGLHPSQLVGQPIDRFGLVVPPRSAERGQANGTVPHGKECRLARADGTVAWCLVTVLPVFLSGEHLRLFALTDLTREKEASELVIQMSKLASLGEAAAAIAHELQQPLGIISLSSELAMNSITARPVDQQRVSVYLQRIFDQAHRSAIIVRRMLHFGRRSTGNQERVSIRESVEAIALLANIRLMPRNIELITDIAAGCPPVSGDAVRVEQVLFNLINNAHDAIVQQGIKAYATVGVEEGGPEFGHRITVRARPADDGAHVLLSVEDTGGGIKPTTLPYLFTPFFTTKAPGKGTGLGLSISKGLVEEMGGRIQAENTAHGARFTITLPSAS
jgi:PAS domain S-box-containing protein